MIGWLLDTNVVAEVSRRGGDAHVRAWMALQSEATMFISVLTLAEYDKGVSYLPPHSEARARIAADIETLQIDYASRVLSVSDRIVRRWGMIAGAVQQQHRLTPPVVDTLLAATAVEHDLNLVTHNVKDVRHSGAAISTRGLTILPASGCCRVLERGKAPDAFSRAWPSSPPPPPPACRRCPSRNAPPT